MDEEIQIPRSKTDQLQKGNEVVVARLSEGTCPVRMLERYIKVTKIRIDSELFSFCQITQVKKRRVVVSYTTMREQFKKKVK